MPDGEESDRWMGEERMRRFQKFQRDLGGMRIPALYRVPPEPPHVPVLSLPEPPHVPVLSRWEKLSQSVGEQLRIMYLIESRRDPLPWGAFYIDGGLYISYSVYHWYKSHLRITLAELKLENISRALQRLRELKKTDPGREIAIYYHEQVAGDPRNWRYVSSSDLPELVREANELFEKIRLMQIEYRGNFTLDYRSDPPFALKG